jgi:preprotein translocase subunit Sss1
MEQENFVTLKDLVEAGKRALIAVPERDNQIRIAYRLLRQAKKPVKECYYIISQKVKIGIERVRQIIEKR